MAKVFISHRTVDKVEAEKLATDLSNLGYDIWLDEWKIDLGDSIVDKINQGLENASYVIVCYSSFGIDSPWMSREWMSSLARQLDGYDIKVLPIMLNGGQPPAILADIKYVDLSTDWKSGLAALDRVIK